MEKVLYILWRDPRVSEDTFARRLRGEVAERLLATGARGLQVNVVDAAVRPAAGLRQTNTHPAVDGLLPERRRRRPWWPSRCGRRA